MYSCRPSAVLSCPTDSSGGFSLNFALKKRPETKQRADLLHLNGTIGSCRVAINDDSPVLVVDLRLQEIRKWWQKFEESFDHIKD